MVDNPDKSTCFVAVCANINDDLLRVTQITEMTFNVVVTGDPSLASIVKILRSQT